MPLFNECFSPILTGVLMQPVIWVPCHRCPLVHLLSPPILTFSSEATQLSMEVGTIWLALFPPIRHSCQCWMPRAPLTWSDLSPTPTHPATPLPSPEFDSTLLCCPLRELPSPPVTDQFLHLTGVNWIHVNPATCWVHSSLFSFKVSTVDAESLWCTGSVWLNQFN